MAELIVAVVIVLTVALTMASKVTYRVPTGQAGLVERLGRYHRTVWPGRGFTLPFIETVAIRIDTTPQQLSVPVQPVVTKDHRVIEIASAVHLQVTEPVSAGYQIADYQQGVEQLLTTSLRNTVGEIDADEVVVRHQSIERTILEALQDVGANWGLRVDRVELILPQPGRQ